MKDLEKAIDVAAKDHGDSYDDIYGICDVARDSFESGAKSEAAKEYWQQGMYTDASMTEALHLGMDGATRFAKSKMYSEKEVAKLATDFFYFWYNAPGENTEEAFDKWFEQNKKNKALPTVNSHG